MTKVSGYGAQSATSDLAPFNFERREPRPYDVQIEILFCGVCHTDLHFVRNEWKNTIYPVVPGHEILGRVTQIGSKVTQFQVGQIAAVGCLVDSCRTCSSCKNHLEQYCEGESVFTYNGHDKIDGSLTYGGYSTQIVVDEKFVLTISDKFPKEQLHRVAPLLCAGITTYSPLRHWKVGKGSRVGVVGIGGLGHMAIKLAHTMGAHVVVFTTSESKKADAKLLGAHEVILSTHTEELKKTAGSLNFIINTAAVPHSLDLYLQQLAQDGTMCLVGVPPTAHPSPNVRELIFRRRSLSGSLIGGIQETQEMLDFCAEHQVLSDVEVIPMDKINEAYKRMLRSDVKYRFVIDMASLKNKT